MEIKVGDYVRTVDGQIGTVRMVTNNMLFINGNQYYYTINDILKCSKNIIDLIEAGDYVNGYKVLRIEEISNNRKVFTVFKSGEKEYCRVWNNEDIKTIVTKEQFESIEYKI